MFTAIPFTNAAAATQTQLISANSSGVLYWRQITNDVTVAIQPVYDSQALHTQGYSTTISVNSAYTNSVTASASLTAGVDAVFATFSATMGVSTTQSFTTGASVSYGIDATVASGRYRIEHVFPRAQVKQQKVFIGYEGTTIQWQRTINNAPKTNDAYRRLNRYANP